MSTANGAARFDTVGKGDRRYLLQKKAGETWYVVVEVPKKLRAVVGKPRLIKSLKTSSLRDAQGKRWAAVAVFKAEIESALTVAQRGDQSLVEEARSVREQLLRANDYGREMLLEGISARIDSLNNTYGQPRFHPNTGEELERIADEALQFAAVVSGEAEALDTYLERWLKGTTYTERTKADARTAVQTLDAWLKETEKPAFISTINDRVAADFRDLGLRAKNVHAKTANKKLSALRQYWLWMGSSGFLVSERNPWDGKSLPKEKVHQTDPDGAGGQERAFTDGEIIKLLNGPAEGDLADMMRIAALSGMRLEEIGQLRAKDCEDGIFDIRRSKTEAGVRTIPIHTALAGIIARRLDNVEPDAFIFPDLKASGWDDTRTMATSKQFAAYRRKVHVDDKRDGARRSKINFHSFRRWFAKQCELTGQHESVVARVMGHRKGVTITFGLYSRAMPVDQMRSCVEAVRLPNEAT